MDDAEALELIDAHLDLQKLSQEQAISLANWLREKPEHEYDAFHRIFLHTYLHQRLQAGSIPSMPQTDLKVSTKTDWIHTPIQVSTYSASMPGPFRARWLKFTSILFCGLAIACCAIYFSFPINEESISGLFLYEGFDYPQSSSNTTSGDGSFWPTTGGLQGLSGGIGWEEPWQESGSKVAIIVGDPAIPAWKPSDMRKFGPLGYSDSEGSVLQSIGRQMRTAAGPTSSTSRRLDLTMFPKMMSDEQGLGTDGTVLWFSFLGQSFDSAGEGRFAYLQLGTKTAGFRIGKLASVPSGNWAAVGLFNGAEVSLRASNVPSGEVVFLVTRIIFRPGNEQVDVWINPKLNAEPIATDATFQFTVPDFRFDELSIISRYSTDIDEIRFGRSFQSVAPVQ
ncbi:hypothetical protein [Gimesia fumaroli]|uniref:Uncharacterized protein n=1 Tax=Gimesia fumaroli TaxID=2527976 RepID=A0A518I9X0_9PLAN|nr:hypothetical protein [Gimesia fumaroli]QDV49850.1 hypothetical protein Enr17x_18710 [Gimesia fumaroli]